MKPEEMRPLDAVKTKDPLSAPIPGSSLTIENRNWNWGNPPEQVDPNLVLDRAIDFLERPNNKAELYKLLIAGISVETLVEGYMIQGFQDGKFSVDVGLLLKPQLALYIAGMAEEDKVVYKLFERDNTLEQGRMSDVEFFKLMKLNNPNMFAFAKESLNQAIREGATTNVPQEKIQEIE